jgi:MATE family multidrug resistance protein
MESNSLSWEHRPWREIIRLSWPITVSTLSYSMMTLVDTLLVGHLGAAQLAGVGLGGTAAFALLCFPFGILRGVKTLVSQAVGARRPQEVGRYLAAALSIAIGMGLVVVGAGQLLAAALSNISASAAAGEAARTYLGIRILGAPLALVYAAIREVRYAQRDARTPMIATVVANAVNIGLALLFIFPLGWGVAGAAIATVIAQGVEAGVAALAQTYSGWNLRGATRAHVRELMRIGLPTGLQFTLEIGAFSLLAGMIAALSEIEMAAHQIALQVIHFSFLPAVAVGEAASVLGGQAVGAGRDDRVVRSARIGLALAAAYTGTCTVILVLFAPYIVAGFGADPRVAVLAVRLLHVAAVFQVLDAANIVARCVLRGASDVRYAAVVGVLSSWAFTPPLMWILGYRMGLGAFGGWLGLTGEVFAGALFLWWRLERRGWQPAAAAARRTLAAMRPSPVAA